MFTPSGQTSLGLTKEYTPHISIGKDIFLFIAAIDCSLLEFNALIAIPGTSGLQAGQEQ